jgi:hypothetical protein
MKRFLSAFLALVLTLGPAYAGSQIPYRTGGSQDTPVALINSLIKAINANTTADSASSTALVARVTALEASVTTNTTDIATNATAIALVNTKLLTLGKSAVVAGGTAGDFTVTGIAVGDQIVAVIRFIGAGVAVTDLSNLTAQFTITGNNTINNTGGTNTTGDKLLVLYNNLTP